MQRGHLTLGSLDEGGVAILGHGVLDAGRQSDGLLADTRHGAILFGACESREL